MSKVIEVVVQANHRTAKEINPLGKKPVEMTKGGLRSGRDFFIKKKKWEDAEKKLKTYDIEFGEGGIFHKYNKKFEAFRYADEGTKLKGRILPNGRIKIIVK